MARFRKIFNFVTLFVVDLLHEFELGVWKATFSHLLRILYAAGGNSIQKLNERCAPPCVAVRGLLISLSYREVPTFGRDTIRKFSRNASGMKKLAGRDFEDLLQVRTALIYCIKKANQPLQCAMPVFEGLLPAPHDAIVLDLLFYLATWHAFAKMRLHTSTTLADFKAATTALGHALRRFASKTCNAFVTQDLPQEEAARGRRKAVRAARAGPASSEAAPPTRAATKKREFNLSTYKLHALGDYVNTIQEFGTTDNYSTQVVRAYRLVLISVSMTLSGRARASSGQAFLCAYKQDELRWSNHKARAP